MNSILNSIVKYWKAFLIGFLGKTMILYIAIFNSVPFNWTNILMAFLYSLILSSTFWGFYFLSASFMKEES